MKAPLLANFSKFLPLPARRLEKKRTNHSTLQRILMLVGPRDGRWSTDILGAVANVWV
jgi:hypothetical protein